MSATAIFDLERAGFTRDQVEALARWHETGLDLSHLATKADLAGVKAELRAEIAEVRAEIAGAKAELKAEIAELRAEFKADLAALRIELKEEIVEVRREVAEVRREVAVSKAELLKWMFGIAAGQLGLLIAVLKLFPSVHP